MALTGYVLSIQTTGARTTTMQPRDTSKRHFYISLIKSGFRIVAAGALVLGSFVAAGVFLFVAELLGILEEL